MLYMTVRMIRKLSKWTRSEIEFLRENYAKTVSSELAKHLKRSPKAIRNKASRLSLRALHRCWSFPRPIKEFKPSADLSYLIGAIKGDGYVLAYLYTDKRHSYQSIHYHITLSAVDFEFVSQVRKSIGEVLGRFPKIGTIYQHPNSVAAGNRIFRVSLCDKSLFTLLKQPLEKLEPYIEVYPTDFLRGFFDAEGSAWTNTYGQSVVKYCNTNMKLLTYVRELLVKLAIYPAPGTYQSTGNLGKTRKTCYFFPIYRKASIKRFMKIVGSSISRKRLCLQ